jgi:HEAT repeat protein
MRNTLCGGLFWAVLTVPLGVAAAEPGGEQLLRDLRSSDEQVRLYALDTLGARGAKIPGAVDALVEQLRSPLPRVRVRALVALGQIGAPAGQAAKAIAALLVDTNVHVRRAAVRAFRDVHPDPAAAIPPLMNVLQDADPAVKIGATDVLAELGKPAVPALTRALGHSATAYWACLALGEIGAEAAPAVPALQDLLETSKNVELRREAVLSLGAIGPPAAPAVRALVRALAAEDHGVRIGAAFALGQIGPAAKAATDPLRELVDGKQPVFLRTLSVWALARINPEDHAALRTAVPMLLDGLKSREPRLRAMAGRALVDLRPEPEVLMPSLLELLQNGNPEVRPDVMNVLGGLGEAAVPGLIKALEMKEVRPRAAAILARLGPGAKEAVPALIRAAQCTDPLARHEALLALGAIGPAAKAAVPAAVKALQDLDPNVRYTACYALGKIGPPAQAAKAPLQEILGDADPFLGLVAAWALARIAPDCSDTAPKAVPLLVRALEDPEATVRLEAATSLRCLGPQAKSAAGALKKTIRDDPSDLVRDMAAEALQSVQE